MKNNQRHLWKSQEYHEHSSVQYEGATALLRNIQFRGDEKVLDVGCGDGKLSAQIASHLPQGSVIGIDTSEDMIRFAKSKFLKQEYPNLSFSIGSATNFIYKNQLDIIFSSFALQWVLDIDAFFSRAYESLVSTGQIVVTIPLGISDALEEAVEVVMSREEWRIYFETFKKSWVFRTEVELKRLLNIHHFHPKVFNIVNQKKVFPSRKDFESYVQQWFPYLDIVPSGKRDAFFREIIDEYIKREPFVENNRVVFQFQRADIIAGKISL